MVLAKHFFQGQRHQNTVCHLFPVAFSCELKLFQFEKIKFCFSLGFLDRDFFQSKILKIETIEAVQGEMNFPSR